VSEVDASRLERYDALFISPHGNDVALACPTRLLAEAESGRRALVLALFEPTDADTPAARAVAELGADYAVAGFATARERGSSGRSDAAGSGRTAADEAAALQALRLLADVGPRVHPLHVYAPLGLGRSLDHLLAYEAAVRAFASEAGRNLFLYEERPEAFVPGAVRTRLALLGARLPPGAAKLAERASLVRHVWGVPEPERLRGESEGVGARFAARVETWRRHRLAAPWNPLRALGPRLHPVVHLADEEARARADAVVHELLPKDRKGRPRAAQRFGVRAAALAKKLGGVYHAERLWLFLPSSAGLPEVQHPLEAD